MAGIVELSAIAIGFPNTPRPILADVSLTIERGEFAAIVGASGAGKSTLLRIIGGLAEPTRGTVRYILTEADDRRPTAIVFQEARLMPWRRVRENVALGLEGLRITREQRDRRVAEALDLVGLRDFGERWPRQLSGGQRQRVGIARALAVHPELLLMDEPFGALDAVTRQTLQDELLRIWHTTGTTILFVTHDIDEATYLADRVLLLGGAPTGISGIYEIPAPRPRQRGDVSLQGITRQLKADLSDLLQEGAGI